MVKFVIELLGSLSTSVIAELNLGTFINLLVIQYMYLGGLGSVGVCAYVCTVELQLSELQLPESFS